MLIVRDSYQVVDNLVEQSKAFFSYPLMQGFPTLLLHHECNTASPFVIILYKPSCSALNGFNSVNILLDIWVPDVRRVI